MGLVQKFYEAYFQALLDTRREQAITLIDDALDQGVSPEEIIFEIVVPAMERLAETVLQEQSTTLAQHFVASQIAAQITDRLLPRFNVAPEIEGRIVLGTSAEDFHGLGKKIVGGCLKANLIEVTDLGLNVAPERFVDEAVSIGAEVIGISSMMVHTARGDRGPQKVREILRERGLEDRIKIAVGGAPYRFHPTLFRDVGADGWAENGIVAAKLVINLIREVRS